MTSEAASPSVATRASCLGCRLGSGLAHWKASCLHGDPGLHLGQPARVATLELEAESCPTVEVDWGAVGSAYAYVRLSETNLKSSHPHTGVGTMGFTARIRMFSAVKRKACGYRTVEHVTTMV
jgi:hypothetical protein